MAMYLTYTQQYSRQDFEIEEQYQLLLGVRFSKGRPCFYNVDSVRFRCTVIKAVDAESLRLQNKIVIVGSGMIQAVHITPAIIAMQTKSKIIVMQPRIHMYIASLSCRTQAKTLYKGSRSSSSIRHTPPRQWRVGDKRGSKCKGILLIVSNCRDPDLLQ